MGGRPVIFVFAKTLDDATASLVKKLDEVVAANTDKKLAAVINFTGEATAEFQEEIAQFAEKNEIENVHLAATADAKKYKISDDAKVTVMHYKGKEVKFNCTVDEDGLDKQAIEGIVEGVSTILE